MGALDRNESRSHSMFKYQTQVALLALCISGLIGCTDSSDREQLMAQLVVVDPMVDTVEEANALFANCTDPELSEIITYYECLVGKEQPDDCGDLLILNDRCTTEYDGMLATEATVTDAECRESIDSAKVAEAAYSPNNEGDALPAGLTVVHRYTGQTAGGFAFIATEGSGDATLCHLGIRGTDNETDVSIDLKSYEKTDCVVDSETDLGRCGSGFLSQLKSLEGVGMLTQVKAMVKDGECPGGLRIHGHSLGGALASLVSTSLYKNAPNTYTREFMHVHTFGEPRVFDESTADSFQELINKTRWLNYGDPVPSAIGSTLGFRHFGAARLISSSFSMWGDTSYTYAPKGQDYTTYNLGPATVYRHKISSYIERLSHCE